MALIKYIHSDFLFSLLSTEKATPNIFSADNCECMRRLLPSLFSQTTQCRNLELIKNHSKAPFSARCPQQSAGDVLYTQNYSKKADKPKTGLQTIGCHSSISQVQTKRCTRKIPDLCASESRVSIGINSPLKSIFMKINLQVSIGFGSPSLLPIPRTAHVLCSVTHSPQQLCPCLCRFISAFLGSEMW